MKNLTHKPLAIALVSAAFMIARPSFALNAAAAEDFLRSDICLMCHSIDQKKEGPAYKLVAKKYRNKADAEERLLQFITSGKVVKLGNGDEQPHRNLADANEDDLRNLIQWILSR